MAPRWEVAAACCYVAHVIGVAGRQTENDFVYSRTWALFEQNKGLEPAIIH